MLSKKKPQDKVDPEYLVGLDTASAQPAPAGVKPFIKKHWKPITADFEVGDTVNKGDVHHLRFELPRDDAGRR